MNIREINELSIVDFLESKGVSPVRRQGRNCWYISPVRLSEKTPSFKVDTVINRWYDHGIGEGGKLFDLVVRLQPNADIKELISIFQRGKLSVHSPTRTFTEKAASISITAVRPLGYHKTLVHYLNTRGLDLETAMPFCNDVQFSLKNNSYYAIGFKNKSGGFELRNSFFKGSSSPKDITLIKNDAALICVTEGFFDFLSLLKAGILPKDASHLVLNSTSLVARSLDIVKEYKNVALALNNDNAGKRAAQQIVESGISVTDVSARYKDFNDVNDWWVQTVIQKKGLLPSRHL